MSARSRVLVNTNTGGTWDVSKLGYATAIAASSQLDITTSFTDEMIAGALQRGDLVLAASVGDGAHILRVETDSGTLDITDSEAFGVYTKQRITDQTYAAHDHDDAEGGSQLVGASALSDASTSGGASKVLVTDGSGDLNLGSDAEIFGLTATPTQDDSAVSKAYVDAMKEGLDPKESVRVATTGDLSATRAANVLTADANGNINTDVGGIDGVTNLAVGDRVLVKNEGGGASSADNGIYEITDLGTTGSAPWVMERTDDADSDAKVNAGMFTFIEEGTTQADQGWVLATNNPITLNTTALQFTVFSSAGQVTAGVGLTKSGSIVNVTPVGQASGTVGTYDGIDFQATGLAVKPKTNAGAADAEGGIIIDTNEELAVKTDDVGLEVNASNQVQLKADGVKAVHINADVAGDGIQQNAGTGALDIDVSDFAGDGLEDDGSENLRVKPDDATGATVAPVNVDAAEGVGVKVDNDTIKHTAGELYCDIAPAKGQKMLLTFGRQGFVPDDTYLQVDGGIFGPSPTFRMIRAGKVAGMSVQCGTAPGTSMDVEVHLNGAQMDATVDINLTSAGGSDDGTGFANNTFSADDLISVYATNLAGSRPQDMIVLVEIELTA